MEKKKIWVVGHKHPDTDSICAAIAYANLKNSLGKKNTEHKITTEYVAKRAGRAVYKRQVNSLADAINAKYFITDFTVWTEVDIWVLTAGWTNVIQLNFLQSTLTGSCLLGFGSICRETGNEFL